MARSDEIGKRILTRNNLGQIQASEPLIDNMISKLSYGFLFGNSETGKSFIALDLSLCVAMKVPFLGYEVFGDAPVLYICSEGQSNFEKRIRAWEIMHGIIVDDDSWLMFPSSIDFAQNEDCAALLSALSGKKFSLIVVDTLAQNIGEAEDSASRDMNIFNRNMLRLIEKFGATVLVIHHPGHGNQDRMRGSTVLRAAADFVFRVKGGSGNILKNGTTIEMVKSKDQEKTPAIALEFSQIQLDGKYREKESLVIAGFKKCKTNLKHSVSGPLNDYEKAVLDSLISRAKNNSSEGVELALWRSDAKRALLKTGCDEKNERSTFKRSKEKLEKKSLIEIDTSRNLVFPL